MLHIFPDYYKDFRCIAGECRHSCCIGWEIAIDRETLNGYRRVTGEMGERLTRSIAFDEDEPHFILGPEERCPFLNKNNLCDLIIGLGEEQLCSVCAEHPRFHTELPGRLESGLGLCCEAAGRLILGKSEPVRFEATGESEIEDDIIFFRDEVIEILQDRDLTFDERCDEVLDVCGTSLPEGSCEKYARRLLSLERLNEDWTVLLEGYLADTGKADCEGFTHFMGDRMREYEQLAVYFIYRHMASAADELSACARAVFAILSCRLLYGIGAELWSRCGEFTLEQQVELARLFSAEVEYSDENLYILLEETETGELWE